MSTTFSSSFLWGAATSAYQIEGGVDDDGRGRSVWDTFCAQPGRVAGGQTGAVAAGHRHRFRADVVLMADLGLQAYRFSVAWPRVQPGGRGPLNEAGIDFYAALVDTLLEHGITPLPTLFHWDLPQELEDAGGWAARDTIHRFTDYAAAVYARLHDRVARWTTLNEPRAHAFLGYGTGEHAPGRRDEAATVAAVHHQLLAHGLAVDAMRSVDGDASFGIALDLAPVTPALDSPDDRDAARRIDGLYNRLFLDPLLLGRYPDDVRADLHPLLDAVEEAGDAEQIVGRLDFLGINYYRPYRVTVGGRASGRRVEGPRAGAIGLAVIDGDHTDNGWAVVPSGLTAQLTSIARTYPPVPIYITENGAAYDDAVVAGVVADERRIAYLDGHLRACLDALAAGVDLRGYLVWSLLDNFEWAEGYRMRFGIVHVDFDTLVRTPKASAHWYRDVIARGGLSND